MVIISKYMVVHGTTVRPVSVLMTGDQADDNCPLLWMIIMSRNRMNRYFFPFDGKFEIGCKLLIAVSLCSIYICLMF